ncbi:MAG: hypothetical protein J0H67_18465 [Rhodospirillales bacterium]|nr:hypothetical protein [Rhodospirillales bacterium]
MRARSLLLLPLLAVAACSQQPGPGQNVAALTTLPAARVCDASLPPFGFVVYARDDAPWDAPPNGRIAMANDGAWCQIRFEHAWINMLIQAPLTVEQPPAHGEVLVGSIGYSLRIAYRPVPGFVGQDHFVVRLHGPDPWDIPVAVTVSP